MPTSRVVVESCKRLRIADLFRSKQVKFNARSTGTWNNIPWTIYLSDRGSTLTIGDRTYELVIEPRMGGVAEGIWWLVRDSTGRRCTTILRSPDGRVGTRWELRARYRSQRMWSEKKQRARQRHKIIERLEGPTDFSWVIAHPDYVPRKPRGSRRMTKAVYDQLIRRLKHYQAPRN